MSASGSLRRARAAAFGPMLTPPMMTILLPMLLPSSQGISQACSQSYRSNCLTEAFLIKKERLLGLRLTGTDSGVVFEPLEEIAAQVPTHAKRRGNFAVLGEGLLVPFDPVKLIQVVDHEPRTLLHPSGCEIAEPMDSLQASAIAQMKTRHRVDRFPGFRLYHHQVAGDGGNEHGLKRLGRVRIQMPIRSVEQCEQCLLPSRKVIRSLRPPLLRQPTHEARGRGE